MYYERTTSNDPEQNFRQNATVQTFSQIWLLVNVSGLVSAAFAEVCGLLVYCYLIKLHSDFSNFLPLMNSSTDLIFFILT